MANHGIPEVPSSFSVAERLFLSHLRNNVIQLLPSRVPPRAPTNLKVTPVAGGNYIQFTKSDGDDYVVYAGSTGELAKATPNDVKLSSAYVDNIGQGGVARFYWVKAKKQGQPDSDILGPVSGVTLALNVPTVVPPAPPLSDSPSNDIEGNIRYGSVFGGQQYNIL